MSDKTKRQLRTVSVGIEKSPTSNLWSWCATVDGDNVYGYEHDYMLACYAIEKTLKEMGVEV